MTLRAFLAVATVAAGALGSMGAEAGAIAVANPSFETLPAGGLPFDGCGTACSYSFDSIPGWVSSSPSTSGQFHPGSSSGDFSYFNYVPDGVTVAFSNSGSISQTVSTIAQAGVTYTLSVDLGFRYDVPDPGTAQVVVNGNAVTATGSGVQNSGNWYDYVATYTASGADAGGAIQIVLNSNDVQGDWDNVRLTQSIPEPATWAMMLVGFFGFVGVTLRRRMVSAL